MSHNNPPRQQEHLPKLRQACDPCHHAKVKCSEDKPCARCRNNNLQCSHSYAIKAGKPKGSKNQKTLQRLEQNRLEAENSQKAGSTDANRKRTRERTDDREDAPPTRPRQFSTSIMSPLSLDMQDPAGDSADNLFSFDVRQQPLLTCLAFRPRLANHNTNQQSGTFPNLTMDTNLSLSPRSNNIDAPFDMEGFSLADAMSMGPTFGSMATPVSNIGATSMAPTGLCTPELQVPANSSQSSPVMRSMVPNFFDAAASEDLMLGKNESDQSNQCFCFSQQAFHLNQLYSLSAQTGVQRLDMWLQSINGTINAVDCFLLCRQCSKDSSSLLVTIATTQLILSQIQNLLSHNGSVRLSIGEYRPSQEDELAMKRLLIERAVLRSKNTLKEIRRISATLVAGPLTPPSHTGTSAQSDVKYLAPVITRLEGILGALMTDLNGEKFKCA